MENEVEIWKDIVDYEGLYRISDNGRVESLITCKILKSALNQGYYKVVLCKDNKAKTIQVHNIMAKAFIDRYYVEKGLVCNHKNFNRGDNRLVNLEIISVRENSNKKHIKSTSNYTGVCWDKRREKWRASIYVGNNNKYLGNFANEKDASDAYENVLKYINSGDFNIDWFKPKARVKSSRHKGVYFDNSHKKWRSYLHINKKNKSLGDYNTEEEAFFALELAKKNAHPYF